MPTAWTCIDSGSSTICTVTATSTTPTLNGNEWLVIMGIIIFFASLRGWPILFSWVKELPKL